MMHLENTKANIFVLMYWNYRPTMKIFGSIRYITFYKKCIHDLGHLLKYLQVQFRGTTGEDESMEVGTITVEYMSTVLNNAANR